MSDAISGTEVTTTLDTPGVDNVISAALVLAKAYKGKATHVRLHESYLSDPNIRDKIAEKTGLSVIGGHVSYPTQVYVGSKAMVLEIVEELHSNISTVRTSGSRTQFSSSNINWYLWYPGDSEDVGTLEVGFKLREGKTQHAAYQYLDVPETVVLDMDLALSKGTYLNEVIKPEYQAIEISE